MTRIEIQNNIVTKTCPSDKWCLKFLQEIKNRKNSFVLETLTAIIFANELRYTYEYQTGRSLEQYFHSGEQLSLGIIVSQLATAVNFMHSQHFVHRDIKPSNILWDGKSITLIDLDTVTTSIGTVKRRGTPLFWPPELVYSKDSTEYKLVDMWAMGVTIFLLDNGYYPFEGEDYEHMALNVIYKPCPKDIRYQPMLGMILSKNPNSRLDSLTFLIMWERHLEK